MLTSDRTMKNIILDFHLFELDEIIKEYEPRLINTNPVLEDNNNETQESIQARLRKYNA